MRFLLRLIPKTACVAVFSAIFCAGSAFAAGTAPGYHNPARAERVASQPDRPNILWIVGENMALDLGVYGMENVATPQSGRSGA